VGRQETLTRWLRIDDFRADLAWRRAPKVLKFRHARYERPALLTSKTDERDGVDGARTASGSMKSRAKMVVVRATV
jgi:hypothetical protein